MSRDLSPTARAALDAGYEVTRELGRGGTAVVYLARERASGTEVAIKLIRSKFLDDEEALARFAREARLVAQLQHPNIVQIRAVLDLDNSELAIVMEHLAGRTLRHLLSRDGFLTPPRAERIIRDIGGALEAAHAAGIIHRDVKPENIFVEDEGRAVLADFGLARSMTGDTQVTMHGVTLGTPAYMAPEQIDGGVLDARSDIYSLGLVGWEMLSGRRPWDGESLYSILYHQKHEVLGDVRDLRDGVPDTLAEVIARSIEKDPDDRWRDVRALLDALESATPNRLSSFLLRDTSETMRFVRTPGTPAPMLSMAELAALIPALEAPPAPRVAPIIARAALGVIIVAVAVTSALVYARSGTAPRREPEVVTAGDVRTAVELRAPIDRSALVSQDSTRSMTPVTSPRPIPAASPAPTPPAPSVSSASSSPPPAAPSDTPTSPITQRPPLDRISVRLPTIAVPLETKVIASGATTIAAGGMHSCFINPAGRALCWGSNDQSQLGGTKGAASGPFAVESAERFASIAAGLSHSCAITRDGSAWCWGNNDHGQLGTESGSPRLAPVLVADAHLFRAIVAGTAHTCGVDAYGLAWCWGSNARGQLGDGTTRDSPVPVNVGGGRFAAIVAGWNFACGLSNTGQGRCWGENAAGQLGDGSTSDRRVPVTVSSATAFTSIAAGSSHACGVTAAGEAYCWGQNFNGQLGDGTTVNRTTPVLVRSTAHFVSIAAGGTHTCAVTDDGAAYCWGRNAYGQLGTGRTADEWLPALVADGHLFASLRAFGSHTCGVTVTGEPLCWGYNLQYQLGDGTRTNRMRPVRVELRGGG